jgi:hypothetical protein
MTRFAIVATLAFAIASTAPAQTDHELSAAYEQGRKLTAKDAAKIDNKLQSKSDNIPDRIRLIAFYTLSSEAPAPEESVKGRRQHLSWMAEHAPESWLWSQRSYGAAIYLSGDRLADPDGFKEVHDIWLGQLSHHPSNETIRANAASFLELGDRETALQLIRGMHNPRYLGTQYALLLLGVTARDYDTGVPLASDPAVRSSPLAQSALAELQNSSDPQLFGGAGFWLARDGGILWSQGKIDWDYSPLAKSLLARAQMIEPNRLDWFVANPSLPQPGEKRAMMSIRTVGAAAESMRLRFVKPEVPESLSGFRGTVSLDVAIGTDGKVIRAIAKSGPPELYAISAKAVEQWKYKPVTVGGNPVIVMTQVEVDYK